MNTYLCAHLSGPQFLQLFSEGFDEHSGFQKVGSRVVTSAAILGSEIHPLHERVLLLPVSIYGSFMKDYIWKKESAA